MNITKKLLTLISAISLGGALFAAPPEGTEAVDCEVKTVPCVITATWGNQSTTKPDATEVCLFKNLDITNIVGLSATSFRAFGGNKFQSFAIDTIYPSGRPTQIVNNFDYNGFYFWNVAEDGQSATFQIQTKANQGYSGCLSGVEFVQLRQVGADIYGSVYGIKYVYGLYYGDDATSKGQSNSCKYYYDDDAMNTGHAVFNFSLQDLKAYYYPATGDLTVKFVGKDGELLDTQTVPAGGSATAPTPPAYEGFVFHQWDRDFTNVRTDMTVQALYHKICKVTFMGGLNGETQIGDPVQVEETKDVPEESVPTATPVAGYVFYAWDKSLTKITDDTVVNALYHRLCTVTFVDWNGTVLKTQTDVEETTSATAPENPTREGWTFNGWVPAFDVVTNDMTVTATYLKDFTVRFYKGIEGVGAGYELISTQAVPDGHAAQAPDAQLAAIDGYVFKGWNEDFSTITSDTSVHGIYNKLWTVRFVESDGTTELAGAENTTQSVENGTAASEPDLDGYTGSPIVGWNPEDFGNVTGDMTIKAVHGTVPEVVTRVVASGKLEGEENPNGILIWNGGASGTWDDATKNWSTPNGLSKPWNAGATAVFADDVTIAVSGPKSVGKIITLLDAKAVTIAGDELDFAAPAATRFAVSGTLRINSNVGGVGYIQMADADVTALTELGGDYVVQVTNGNSPYGLTVSNGTIRVVGEGKLGGGVMKDRIYMANDTVFEYASSVTQELYNVINATSTGSSYLNVKSLATTGKFNIASGSAVVVKETGEGNVRCFNEIDVYGTLTFGNSVYHYINANKYGIVVKAGGVLNRNKGNGQYGFRDARITCEKGGTVNYGDPTGAGQYDSWIKLLGGTLNATKDYSSSNDDNSFKDMTLSDGALVTGEMITWACSTHDNKLTVSGTNACSITLNKIRVGRKGSNAKFEQLVIGDVTGDEKTDVLVTSKLYKHASATGTASSYGLYKKGAGTIEFAGADCDLTGASLKMEAGTVRFGSTASGAFGALIVTGDSTLDIDSRARITFDDASSMAWTDGATLTLSGTMSSKSLRIGTSGASLTAAQLGQIKYRNASGKLKPVTLSDDGYILPPGGALVIMIR